MFCLLSNRCSRENIQAMAIAQLLRVDRVRRYVEISGELDVQARSLRIDSLKLLEKGRAMCDVPAKKKS